MRALILAAAALLLAACSTFLPGSNSMPAGRAALQMDATATLASVDTCEYEIAPLYTRLIVARKNATRRLEQGRIGVDEAKRVQATGDAARALLDRACPDGRTAKKVDRDVVKRAADLLGSLK